MLCYDKQCIDYSFLFACVTTVVDCGQLPAPENGVIDSNLTTFNSTARYSCDAGYELFGDLSRTCLANGNWSDSQPSCIGESCCYRHYPKFLVIKFVKKELLLMLFCRQY